MDLIFYGIFNFVYYDNMLVYVLYVAFNLPQKIIVIALLNNYVVKIC